MSDVLTPCIEGCTRHGKHLPDCTGYAADGIDPCRGCQPRPAEFGLLCAFGWQRLNADVVDAPGLVRHLRDMAAIEDEATIGSLPPGRPTMFEIDGKWVPIHLGHRSLAHLTSQTPGLKPPSDTRSHLDPAEGAILSTAVDAADELHATLTSWAMLILEKHPHGSRMTGPDPRGAWLTQYGATAGIRDPEATARLVRWLLPLLPWCSEQEWAGEMRRELSEMIATTKARWPMDDTRTRPIRDTPCPRCDRIALTYTPPAVYRAPFVVACSNPECGRIFTEDEWERLAGLVTIAASKWAR